MKNFAKYLVILMALEDAAVALAYLCAGEYKLAIYWGGATIIAGTMTTF